MSLDNLIKAGEKFYTDKDGKFDSSRCSKDAQTASTAFQQDGSFPERIKKAVQEIQGNHKSYGTGECKEDSKDGESNNGFKNGDNNSRESENGRDNKSRDSEDLKDSRTRDDESGSRYGQNQDKEDRYKSNQRSDNDEETGLKFARSETDDANSSGNQRTQDAKSKIYQSRDEMDEMN